MKKILVLSLLVLTTACNSPAVVTPLPPTETIASTATSVEIATQSPSAPVSQVEQPSSTLSPTATSASEPTATETVNEPFTGIEGFPENLARQFPREIFWQSGAYGMYGIIKEISFNTDGEKVTSESNVEATSFLLVEYYDVNGNKQELLVGASYQDETYGDTGSFSILAEQYSYGAVPSGYYIESFINNVHSVGNYIGLIFGMPNATSDTMDQVGYTNDLISATYSEDQMAEFARTGDPSVLDSKIFVPLTLDIFDND